MRCPICDQSDEVILEKKFGYTDYGDGIYYCERCKIRFQVEIFDLESEVCKSCNNCSNIRYAYQTKEPYCIARGIYVNEKTITCDKFNPKESEVEKNEH